MTRKRLDAELMHFTHWNQSCRRCDVEGMGPARINSVRKLMMMSRMTWVKRRRMSKVKMPITANEQRERERKTLFMCDRTQLFNWFQSVNTLVNILLWWFWRSVSQSIDESNRTLNERKQKTSSRLDDVGRFRCFCSSSSSSSASQLHSM